MDGGDGKGPKRRQGAGLGRKLSGLRRWSIHQRQETGAQEWCRLDDWGWTFVWSVLGRRGLSIVVGKWLWNERLGKWVCSMSWAG